MRSVSAVARVGRSGREDNKSTGQEDAYQSRRSRDVGGESGSARRRVRQRGVCEWEESMARRRERHEHLRP